MKNVRQIYCMMLLLLLAACAADAQIDFSAKNIFDSIVCNMVCVIEYIIAGVSALTMILAGARYMTCEDPDTRTEMKRYIAYALAGLFVVFGIVPAANVLSNYGLAPFNCGCINFGAQKTVEDCYSECTKNDIYTDGTCRPDGCSWGEVKTASCGQQGEKQCCCKPKPKTCRELSGHEEYCGCPQGSVCKANMGIASDVCDGNMLPLCCKECVPAEARVNSLLFLGDRSNLDPATLSDEAVLVWRASYPSGTAISISHPVDLLEIENVPAMEITTDPQEIAAAYSCIRSGSGTVKITLGGGTADEQSNEQTVTCLGASPDVDCFVECTAQFGTDFEGSSSCETERSCINKGYAVKNVKCDKGNEADKCCCKLNSGTPTGQVDCAKECPKQSGSTKNYKCATKTECEAKYGNNYVDLGRCDGDVNNICCCETEETNEKIDCGAECTKQPGATGASMCNTETECRRAYSNDYLKLGRCNDNENEICCCQTGGTSNKGVWRVRKTPDGCADCSNAGCPVYREKEVEVSGCSDPLISGALNSLCLANCKKIVLENTVSKAIQNCECAASGNLLDCPAACGGKGYACANEKPATNYKQAASGNEWCRSAQNPGAKGEGCYCKVDTCDVLCKNNGDLYYKCAGSAPDHYTALPAGDESCALGMNGGAAGQSLPDGKKCFCEKELKSCSVACKEAGREYYTCADTKPGGYEAAPSGDDWCDSDQNAPPSKGSECFCQPKDLAAIKDCSECIDNSYQWCEGPWLASSSCKKSCKGLFDCIGGNCLIDSCPGAAKEPKITYLSAESDASGETGSASGINLKYEATGFYLDAAIVIEYPDTVESAGTNPAKIALDPQGIDASFKCLKAGIFDVTASISQGGKQYSAVAKDVTCTALTCSAQCLARLGVYTGESSCSTKTAVGPDCQDGYALAGPCGDNSEKNCCCKKKVPAALKHCEGTCGCATGTCSTGKTVKGTDCPNDDCCTECTTQKSVPPAIDWDSYCTGLPAGCKAILNPNENPVTSQRAMEISFEPCAGTCGSKDKVCSDAGRTDVPFYYVASGTEAWVGCCCKSGTSPVQPSSQQKGICGCPSGQDCKTTTPSSDCTASNPCCTECVATTTAKTCNEQTGHDCGIPTGQTCDKTKTTQAKDCTTANPCYTACSTVAPQYLSCDDYCKKAVDPSLIGTCEPDASKSLAPVPSDISKKFCRDATLPVCSCEQPAPDTWMISECDACTANGECSKHMLRDSYTGCNDQGIKNICMAETETCIPILSLDGHHAPCPCASVQTCTQKTGHGCGRQNGQTCSNPITTSDCTDAANPCYKDCVPIPTQRPSKAELDSACADADCEFVDTAGNPFDSCPTMDCAAICGAKGECTPGMSSPVNYGPDSVSNKYWCGCCCRKTALTQTCEQQTGHACGTPTGQTCDPTKTTPAAGCDATNPCYADCKIIPACVNEGEDCSSKSCCNGLSCDPSTKRCKLITNALNIVLVPVGYNMATEGAAFTSFAGKLQQNWIAQTPFKNCPNNVKYYVMDTDCPSAKSFADSCDFNGVWKELDKCAKPYAGVLNKIQGIYNGDLGEVCSLGTTDASMGGLAQTGGIHSIINGKHRYKNEETPFLLFSYDLNVEARLDAGIVPPNFGNSFSITITGKGKFEPPTTVNRVSGGWESSYTLNGENCKYEIVKNGNKLDLAIKGSDWSSQLTSYVLDLDSSLNSGVIPPDFGEEFTHHSIIYPTKIACPTPKSVRSTASGWTADYEINGQKGTYSMVGNGEKIDVYIDDCKFDLYVEGDTSTGTHELGHNFNLGHNKLDNCIMSPKGLWGPEYNILDCKDLRLSQPDEHMCGDDYAKLTTELSPYLTGCSS